MDQQTASPPLPPSFAKLPRVADSVPPPSPSLDNDRVMQRYASGYRLIAFLQLLSYIVLGIGALFFVGSLLVAVADNGRIADSMYVVSIMSLVISVLVAVGLQGCASVLRAVTDTAVVTLGGKIK